MRLPRLLVPLLLAGALLIGTAPAALAHAVLKSSNPAEGATLTAPPTTVSLTFAEAVTLPANPVRVTGPGGATWTVGTATVAGPVVTVPVQPSGPAGAYTLNYTVISDDGDEAKGAVHFTLTAAVTPTTSAAPTTTAAAQPPTTAAAASSAAPQPPADAGGIPVWVWVVVAIAVIALVVLLVRRARAGSSPPR